MSDAATGRNIEALRQLRRVIEAAPEDRLHMRAWSENAECGTAYCAAGWAAIDPWFQQHTSILETFRVSPHSIVYTDYAVTAFSRLDEIFRIGIWNSEALFGKGINSSLGPHSVTKAEVLQRIDALIAGGDIEPYAAAVCVDDDDDDDDLWDDDDDLWDDEEED